MPQHDSGLHSSTSAIQGGCLAATWSECQTAQTTGAKIWSIIVQTLWPLNVRGLPGTVIQIVELFVPPNTIETVRFFFKTSSKQGTTCTSALVKSCWIVWTIKSRHRPECPSGQNDCGQKGQQSHQVEHMWRLLLAQSVLASMFLHKDDRTAIHRQTKKQRWEHQVYQVSPNKFLPDPPTPQKCDSARPGRYPNTKPSNQKVQNKHSEPRPTSGQTYTYRIILATMVSQSSTSLICTVPEMCRRYIWALTRPPCPPFDVAHVESDSECLWCHRAMWCVHDVCHVPSLMAHPHLALMLTCSALATATSRRKAFCSSATTQQKKAEHGNTVFHTASFGYPEAATNFFMAQDSVCENALMMHLKIFKYGWFQTPRDCHRLEEILHILDHKSKLFLSFSSSILSILDFHWSNRLFAFSFLRPDFGMIWSRIGSNMVSRHKVLICDLCACWAYKDSSAWWCDDWLEPSITKSIVTARKWLLKALWNFKIKKSSRIKSSEHQIIKQKRRSCHDSWSKPRQQFLDHAHLTHWKKSCAVTPMSTYLLICRHRRDGSGQLQVVTSTLQVVKTLWLQASTIATAMLYLTKVSKQNLGQNFSGDSPGCRIVSVCQLDQLSSASWIPFVAKHAEFWLIGPAESWESVSVRSLQIQFVSQGKNHQNIDSWFNMIETSKNFWPL